ncbi:MAG: sialidase, partial [Longimicrobiales bacterium]
AYRFRAITPPSVPYDDPTQGEDPEYGASINYWLKAPAQSAPTVTILDASGTAVRTLEGTNRAGVNRIHWDLEDEPTTQLRLLTSPLHAEHIRVPDDGRSAPGAGRISILMPPGQYTVKLTVDGVEHTRPLTVLRDPHSAGSEADIAEQVALLRSLKTDLERGVAAVARIEKVRAQLASLVRFSDDADVKAAAGALADKLVAQEMELLDLRLTGEGQDGVRFEARLLQKIGYLANGLDGADFRPTDQQVEVRGILAAQLDVRLRAVDALLSSDLVGLNTMLRARGVTIVAEGG